MFEKEAEEYFETECLHSYADTEEQLKEDVVPAFQKGAEFGYNKAKAEIKLLKETHRQSLKILTDQIEELHKANEWHYVSKEGHPNKDDIYLTIRKDGLHLGDFCQGGDGDIDCQSWCDYPSEEEIQDDSVIAWKEIVLP